MKQYQVAIVDDETRGQIVLEQLLSTYKSHFKIIASCSSVQEAKKVFLTNKPDLIFLDIQMPTTNGLELAEELKTLDINAPFVFVTAHPEHMKEAFKVQPFDYLLKPIDRLEFAETLRRFKKAHPIKETKCCLPQSILTNNGFEFIDPENIAYIVSENRKNYIFRYNGTHCITNKTLGELLKRISCNQLIRIHKSCAINLSYINSFSSPYVYIKLKNNKTVRLTVGRTFLSAIKKQMGL